MKSKEIPVHKIDSFYANIASEHMRKHPCILDPHKHDHFLILICTKGTGIHEVDFKQYPVKKGNIFMVAPGQTHKWKLSPDIDGYVIKHTVEFYDIYYANKRVREYPFYCTSFDSPGIELQDEEYNYAISIFKEILIEKDRKADMNMQLICSLLDILYIHLSRIYPPHKGLAKSKHNYLVHLRKLEDLIEENFKTIKSPSEYADLMNLSLKQVNRICKFAVNKTTSDIITDRVILEAKRMLVYGANSIEEVADSLGYFDQSYFSRLFKNKTGLTPVEFMREHK